MSMNTKLKSPQFFPDINIFLIILLLLIRTLHLKSIFQIRKTPNLRTDQFTYLGLACYQGKQSLNSNSCSGAPDWYNIWMSNESILYGLLVLVSLVPWYESDNDLSKPQVCPSLTAVKSR